MAGTLALNGQSVAALDSIPERMRETIRAHEVPGVVTAVATRDSVLRVDAQGAAGPGSAEPMRTDSIFWIASMTKPITATAVMMLNEAGKLSIDDPVGKYIPQLAALHGKDGKPVTVTLRQMLTHTSGMAEPTADEAAGAKTLGELMPAIASKTLLFEPGSEWRYCQAGINTLARVVEVVSGEPFPEFLSKRLFEPLGMKDTTFYLTQQQMARYVVPAKREGDALVPDSIGLLHGLPPTSHEHYPAGNGGLFSTAPDYLRFARMVLNGGALDGKRYLKPESVRLMTTVQSGELKTGFTPGNGWGLGWCVVRQPQGITSMLSPGTFGHGGAYGTQAWIDPEKGLALVLMVQRSNFKNSDDSEVRRAFQEALLPSSRSGLTVNHNNEPSAHNPAAVKNEAVQP